MTTATTGTREEISIFDARRPRRSEGAHHAEDFEVVALCE
jgi:hypothetical protein